MKNVFGLIAGICVCLSLLAAGCPEKTGSQPPSVQMPTAKITPARATGAIEEQPARSAEELKKLQTEAADVAQSFLDALQEEDWAKATEFFCAEFQETHRQGLLDGSLLQKDRGKQSAVSVLFGGKAAWYGTIRGDRAWVGVSAGGGSRHAKIGLATLELVREDGKWKLPCFPTCPYARDAARAGRDGEAAGRWFKGMLSDGEFTEEEQAEIAEVLDRYYAIVVQMRSQVEDRPLPPPDYRLATMEQLTEIYERLKARPDLEVHSITFWPKPSEDVVCVGEALTEQAVRQIYEDLAAAKDKYPELAKFDEEHVRLSEGSLSYSPNPAKWRQKVATPTIHVSIRTPYFGASQRLLPPRIYFPRQRLEVGRLVVVDDDELRELVIATIEKNVEPLIRFEKLLDSEAVYDNW